MNIVYVEFAVSMRDTERHHKTINPEYGVRILSTIDFTHLRLLAIYATVVECGSFAAAARKVNSSRSRISEQIAQLESDLDVRLLQRSTRQLTITTEGQQVFEQARQLPEILQGVEAITTPSVPSGRVAITMNHDIGHKYVLPVLEDFQRQFPQIQLDLILDDARRDLIAEQIDLAIRIGIPRDESLIARMMHEERFALFSSPELLQKHGTPETLAAVEQLPWVMLDQPANPQLNYNGKTFELKPEKAYRCNSPLMVQQMVMQGLGVGIMLPTTMSKEISSGRLVQIMPALTSEALVFALVYPSRRQLPLRTRTVIDYLLTADIFGR